MVVEAEFLAGVVEGFYGRPWSHQQRLDLFRNMAGWGLNTYFYSPKDDLKHRACWRETYDAEETARMGQLVSACQENGLKFFYGLSPGLDIHFSKSAEIERIKERFRQLQQMGTQHFALLFDDLPGEMRKEDSKQFPSIAAAQAYVANQVYNWLYASNSDARLLFCPTPYCDRMVKWKLGGEDYLDDLGAELHPNIEVLWTGPEIISFDISLQSLEVLEERIRRKPIIWDNLHANDYDVRRLYCGPYSRPKELKSAVRGILSNPNEEYPINFVPLRTLADFVSDDTYDPLKSYGNAVQDWAQKFQTHNGQVQAEDVRFLADCYYLPDCNGASANRLLDVVHLLLSKPVDDWTGEFEELEAYYYRSRKVCEQLTELNDRELFYAWSRRTWELREELELIYDFVKHKKVGKRFQSETHLPKTYRGGLVAQIQRMLNMNDDGSFGNV